MSNIVLSYKSYGDDAATALTYSSQHPNFPASNVQHRWFKKPWRSKYGAGSGWGTFRITTANQKIYFNEGGGNLTATLTPGDYDATSLCAQIKTQMDAAGLTYTITYSDVTNKFTFAISAGSFKLLLSNQTNAVWSSLGWTTLSDTGVAASQTSDTLRVHTVEELKFDLGAAKTIKAIFLKFNNFQSTATIQIRFYSDAWITLAKTINVTSVTMPILSTDISAYFTNDSYRYVMVYMSDPSNPNLYLQLGRVWIYTYFEPHYGFTMERTMTGNDPSVMSFSDDGQAASIQKSRYSTWEYNFDAVKPSEKASFDEIFQYFGTTLPLFICENPDVANPNLHTHYVTITGWEW